MQVMFRFYLNSGLGRPPKQPKYLQFRAEGCCGAYLGGSKCFQDMKIFLMPRFGDTGLVPFPTHPVSKIFKP